MSGNGTARVRHPPVLQKRVEASGADEDRRDAHGPDHQRRDREAAVSQIGLERKQRSPDAAENVYEGQGGQADL